MKEHVQNAVNDQIQAEFASAYQYLAMAARFDGLNLPGFTHWLRMQWEEETQHAMKFYDHLLNRGARVELKAIERPDPSFETPLEAFERVLRHEQYISSRINDLYELAVTERDYPLQGLLRWFIDEQVEEEASAGAIVERLRLVGASGPALLMVDRELAQRAGAA